MDQRESDWEEEYEVHLVTFFVVGLLPICLEEWFQSLQCNDLTFVHAIDNLAKASSGDHRV